ncbi:MAG: 16S rRNA (cytidine(1402)-2'-O)-methyltransferase [Pikeienuella sp.]
MTARTGSKRGDFGETGAKLQTFLPQGLYLAATPIGASQDLTYRAKEALEKAHVIAAEDTRRALKLMTLHGVSRAGRPMVPYHDHNGAQSRPRLLSHIAAGESVVYVSDAGTPLIADPGWKLAQDVIEADLPVYALPGASALLAALSVAGLPTDRFMFCGFLPPKQAARRADLSSLAAVPGTLVFYESPRRLAAMLEDMAAILGDRPAAVCRELTKLHEEVRRDSLSALATHYHDAGPPKGEIVIVIGPPLPTTTTTADIDAALTTALQDMRVKDAAKTVADALGLPRKEVYARALTLKDQ